MIGGKESVAVCAKNHSNRPKLNRRQVVAAITSISLIFIILLIAITILNAPPKGTPMIDTIVDDSITISAGSYKDYQFSISSEALVQGTLTILDSNESQTKVYVVDDDNFNKFKNEQAFSTYYNSEGQANATIAIRLTQLGIYHLIFDNTFSTIQVNIEADVKYSRG